MINPQSIYLTTDGGGLNVTGDEFGPLQMLATSLALCTASVVHAYGETAQLSLDGFAVAVAWEYADGPHRVGSFALTLHLPATVPEGRHRAILRAAETCTVHNTLLHSPAITSAVAPLADAPAVHHHVHEA